MSKENVKKFYEELAKNEELQKKIQAIGQEKSKEVFENSVLPVAKEFGFEFTIAEFEEYAKETPNSPLNDSELDTVSGGFDYAVIQKCGAVSFNAYR